MICTFYSYKGGVGRTMALANIAELFYRSGKKVLIVDWDLEAPGLERFFPEIKDALDKPGLIEMLVQYKEVLSREINEQDDAGNILRGLTNKFRESLIEIYPSKKDGRNIGGQGKLFLLTAGRRSPTFVADYANTVINFDWRDFYGRWNGEVYFEWLRKQFEAVADIVLIDSRTGVTEMGGVCTYQLADVVVMFCAPNLQNLDGTGQMARSFLSPKVRQVRIGRPLDLVIIPARIEKSLGTALDDFQERFKNLFGKQLKLATSKFWDARIPYNPNYAFTERIAVRDEQLASGEDLVTAFDELRMIIEDSLIKRQARPENFQSDIARSVGIYRLNEWLAEFGFRHNPFDYQHAEQMADEAMRQATYVEHYQIERFLDISTVILTPRGGGKTTMVLKIKDALQQIRENSFNGLDRDGIRFPRPLVAHYTLADDKLIEKASRDQTVTLKDHIRPLLYATAEPLFELISTHPETFLNLNSGERIWFWTYLQLYLEGTKLDIRLPFTNQLLYQDWLENKTRLAAELFSENSRLSVLLKDMLTIISHLGLDSIIILLDGAERFKKTVSASQQANLLRPLLNANDILSIDRVFWQFFLPDNLQAEVNVSSNITTGRLATPLRILWTEEKLQQLLQLRLEWASNNKFISLNEIVDPVLLGVRDIDAELARLALKYPHIQGAPRALLMISNQFLAALAQNPTRFNRENWLEFFEQLPVPASPELIIRSVGLPPDLLHGLQNTLEQCEQFQSNKSLHRLFVDERLRTWYSNVPEAATLSLRVQFVIVWLLQKWNSNYGNGLVRLLYVLKDVYSPEDYLHKELSDLTRELEHYLSSFR